ncbi:MAG: hypothetical protein AB1547_03490 [Thermodesulfobacteriota bacterium]
MGEKPGYDPIVVSRYHELPSLYLNLTEAFCCFDILPDRERLFHSRCTCRDDPIDIIEIAVLHQEANVDLHLRLY